MKIFVSMEIDAGCVKRDVTRVIGALNSEVMMILDLNGILLEIEVNNKK